MKITVFISVAVLSSFLLVGCGGSTSNDETAGTETTETDTAGTETTGTDTTGTDTTGTETIGTDTTETTPTDLSDVEKEGLLFMREEEELARDLYLDIYEATGSRLKAFYNISNNAEKEHAEAIRVLLEKYGLEDPSTGVRNTYTDPELQDLYNQLLSDAIGSDDLAAYRVGAMVEETDIRDINEHKSHVSEVHTDIIETYENLLCGSRNHLRSFAKNIEKITGESYATQVPELDAEVQAIITSDTEKCGDEDAHTEDQ